APRESATWPCGRTRATCPVAGRPRPAHHRSVARRLRPSLPSILAALLHRGFERAQGRKRRVRVECGLGRRRRCLHGQPRALLAPAGPVAPPLLVLMAARPVLVLALALFRVACGLRGRILARGTRRTLVTLGPAGLDGTALAPRPPDLLPPVGFGLDGRGGRGDLGRRKVGGRPWHGRRLRLG